jgi:hypothetical protein
MFLTITAVAVLASLGLAHLEAYPDVFDFA